MKKEELMIGDLVRVSKDVCFKKGTIVKIHGIDADHVFPEKGLKGVASCKPANDPSECTSGVWLDYLEPIPLTEEILLNNGFDKIKPNGYTSPRQEYAYSSDFEDVYAEEINDGMWKIDIDSVEFNLPRRTMLVGYVHTLQHVLKECAVDNDIKIKEAPNEPDV